jgi:hypothetical protein
LAKIKEGENFNRRNIWRIFRGLKFEPDKEIGQKGTLVKGLVKNIMGRTVLPYSQILEREYQDWKKFRRGLRREDQAVLDRLFDLARLHVQAGVYASRPWPLETILVSILIEQEKALTVLRERLKTLEERNREIGCPENG